MPDILLPPQHQEAERMVIGSILLNSDSIYKIIDLIVASDFYAEKNKQIYQSFLTLINKKTKIDIITLKEEIKIEESYLVNCANSVATASNIVEYAKIVKDKSLRRQLIVSSLHTSQMAYNEQTEIDSVISEIQDKIFKIQNPQLVKDDTKTILSELEETQKEYGLKYQSGEKYLGIPCGIEKLDEAIDGLRPGHIWAIGAWAGTGKTGCVMNVVHNVASLGVPVSVISLEMGRVDLAARLIGIRHNLSATRILKGINDEETTKKIIEGKEWFSNLDLEIHTTYFEIEKIKLLIRKDAYSRKVKLIVLDYVQNILSEKSKREYELLTQSATELQALARELGITIILVSQISNEAEKGVSAGAGYKGTGTLEAVADLAIRLKRNKENEIAGAEFVSMKIIFSKNRHGFSGYCDDYVMWLRSGKFELTTKVVEEIKF